MKAGEKGSMEMSERVGVQVLLEAGNGNPQVVHIIIPLPLDEQTATGTTTPIVEERFDVEMFFPVDDIRQWGVADGGGVKCAGEGFESRDVDDGVMTEVDGEVEAIRDVGVGGEDAVRAIKFGPQLAV